jgi:hypothetical protein
VVNLCPGVRRSAKTVFGAEQRSDFEAQGILGLQQAVNAAAHVAINPALVAKDADPLSVKERGICALCQEAFDAKLNRCGEVGTAAEQEEDQ